MPDFRNFGFGEPVYLWLLVGPGVLLALWLRQALNRRADIRRAVRVQVLPVRERYRPIGDLAFWLCVIVAVSCCVLAIARPQARLFVASAAGVDFVILQDGSASMYVKDVAPDRWQRSMRFVRTFAESLSWKQDRAALALFAHFTAPQVRLTKDPRALLFFLDHLSEQSPFRLEDDPTWNTNIEEAVHWGLKLVETNDEMFGKTTNPRAFIVISDGQSWSGEVATALAAARGANVTVDVVGVGTTAGGYIPERAGSNAPLSLFHAVLDRDSLRDIARAGGGEYYEMGHEPDRDVASRIISNLRRRAPMNPREETREELYWRFLMAAAVFLCVGTLLLRQRTELWWQAAAALAAVALLATVAAT